MRTAVARPLTAPPSAASASFLRAKRDIFFVVVVVAKVGHVALFCPFCTISCYFQLDQERLTHFLLSKKREEEEERKKRAHHLLLGTICQRSCH